MPVDRLRPSDLRGVRVHYVLEYVVASRTLYYSHAPLDIVWADGTLIQVDAGLSSEIDWSEEMAFTGTSVPIRSVSVRLLDPQIDWSAMHAAGFDPAAGRCELSQWVEGTTWDTRRLLVRGLPDRPVYAAQGEELAFTLKAHPSQDRAVFPPATHIVDATTWPSASDEAAGVSYPQVFGHAGKGRIRYAGSIGVIVHVANKTLMVAGHDVEASAVEVMDAAKLPSGTWVTLAVSQITDGRGVTVSVVTLPTAVSGDADFDETATYAVSWGHSTNGGGRYNRERTGAMRDAGEVLEFLFNRSTMDVDRGRTAATADLLRGRKLDFVVQEPTGVWDLISGRILPALPVSIRNGPSGLYPVSWRQDVTSGQPRRRLSVARGEIAPVGSVVTESTLHGQLANEFRVAYCLDVAAGQTRGRFLLHGDPAITPDANTATNRACRISRARYTTARAGAQSTPAVMTVATDVICDGATASALAYDLATMHALPSRVVSYLVDREETALEEGTPVEITHAAWSLADAFGLIKSVSIQPDESRLITVRLIEDAAR